MGFENHKPKEDTGRLYEAKFLGEFGITDEFVEAERKLERDERGRYRDPEALYSLLKKHYRQDPTEPAPGYARDLRLEIVDALGLEADEESRLKVYSTLKTPIDYKFGVDGFVELEDPETGKTVRVTLDVTMNRRKMEEARTEGSKADVVIGPLPDAVQEEDDYLKALAGYAKDIGARLEKRLSDVKSRGGRKAA